MPCITDADGAYSRGFRQRSHQRSSHQRSRAFAGASGSSYLQAAIHMAKPGIAATFDLTTTSARRQATASRDGNGTRVRLPSDWGCRGPREVRLTHGCLGPCIDSRERQAFVEAVQLGR